MTLTLGVGAGGRGRAGGADWFSFVILSWPHYPPVFRRLEFAFLCFISCHPFPSVFLWFPSVFFSFRLALLLLWLFILVSLYLFVFICTPCVLLWCLTLFYYTINSCCCVPPAFLYFISVSVCSSIV